MKTKIYQIFYDEASLLSLTPGFLPLDNTKNERPEWREYWPIRQWAETNEFEENTYYGFFSPKFTEKTRLTSKHVFEYIEVANTEVISFSPFLDHSAIFLNIFEQGEVAHPGLLSLAQRFIDLENFSVQISSIFNDHSRFIFSNFFVAKKVFWELWLQFAERIYQHTDQLETELGKDLSNIAPYKIGEYVPYKVFMVERLASLILNLYGEFSVKCYPPTLLPMGGSLFAKYKEELNIANALKIAYLNTGETAYLNAMLNIRQKLIDLVMDKKG